MVTTKHDQYRYHRAPLGRKCTPVAGPQTARMPIFDSRLAIASRLGIASRLAIASRRQNKRPRQNWVLEPSEPVPGFATQKFLGTSHDPTVLAVQIAPTSGGTSRQNSICVVTFCRVVVGKIFSKEVERVFSTSDPNYIRIPFITWIHLNPRYKGNPYRIWIWGREKIVRLLWKNFRPNVFRQNIFRTHQTYC